MIRSSSTHSTRGFTLLEVLIAVALLATGLVLVLGAMQSSLRMEQKSKHQIDAHMSAVTTIKRMVDELSMAFYVSDVSEDVAENREIRYRTIFEGKREQITFTTMGYQQRFSDDAGGDQAAITYRIDRRTNRQGKNRAVLVRREEAPIDDRPERGGRLTEVLEGVKRIRFEYWDPTREIAEEAWVDSWDTSHRKDELLPERVRVTLEVEDPDNARKTLSYQMEAQIALVDPLLLLPADVAKQMMQQRRAEDDQIEDAGGNPSQVNQNRTSTRDQVREAAGKR